MNALTKLWRRIRCNHQDNVWLNQVGDPKSCLMPVKVCVNCQKLTWASMKAPNQFTFVIPQPIGAALTAISLPGFSASVSGTSEADQ